LTLLLQQQLLLPPPLLPPPPLLLLLLLLVQNLAAVVRVLRPCFPPLRSLESSWLLSCSHLAFACSCFSFGDADKVDMQENRIVLAMLYATAMLLY
jgi:hypothetical protein